MGRKRKIPEEQYQELFSIIDEYLEKGQKPNFAFLYEQLLNYIMNRERDIYLKKNPFDLANGFYNRKLNINLGELNIKVPRVRIGNSFRPMLLPPKWKRVDKDYEELLIAMLTNGYSKAKIRKTLKKLGLSFSEDSLEIVEDLMQEKLEYFKTRPLEADWFAVFIDAYQCDLKEVGKMNKISIFVPVGIDLNGYKHILGFYVFKGVENLAMWKNVIQDLISRGLSKVLIFITDNFSGLTKLLKKFFPLSQHQLCFVHLARNLKSKLSPKNRKLAISIWQKIKIAYDYNEGAKFYDELLDIVQKEEPDYAKFLQKHKENYLNFLNYPENVRKFIYTTNIVESINSGLEKMRYDVGGYFPSRKTLDINLFVQLVNLHDNWMRKPVPLLKNQAYYLKQLFGINFNLNNSVVCDIHNF